jgi:hypothetical protein
MPSRSENMRANIHNFAWVFTTAKDLNPKYAYRCSNLARVTYNY